ncbi:MAG: hypothetical protein ABW020_17100 [Candidatus Rokuibacteriota bacterium]
MRIANASRIATLNKGDLEELVGTVPRDLMEGFTAVNRRLDVVEAQASRTEQRVDVLESRVGAVEAPKSRRRRPRSS